MLQSSGVRRTSDTLRLAGWYKLTMFPFESGLHAWKEEERKGQQQEQEEGQESIVGIQVTKNKQEQCQVTQDISKDKQRQRRLEEEN